jgi:hypothetical protein
MKPGEQVERKAPTAPSEGAGAARGSGATPRDAASSKLYRYAMLYRHTLKTGALTYPIAICAECGRVVEPIRKEYSKTGAHGKWYYAHKHQLKFIILRQSNSGKRSVTTMNKVPDDLLTVVKEAWIDLNTSTDFVERVVKEWLFLYSEGHERDLVLIPNPDGSVSIIEAGDW